MNKIIKTGLLALMAVSFTACDDVFSPLPENNLDEEYIEKSARNAENVIGTIYAYFPTFDVFNLSEAATDDAVSNDASNSWRRIAAGSWTSSFNPVNRWEITRTCIQYSNLFLKHLDGVVWTKDPNANKYFHDRYYGEAHALRGIMMYHLLQAHGGPDNSGKLLGVPIVLEFEDENSEFNVPRNTFKECYDAMMSDFAVAQKYLPYTYQNYDSKDPAALEALQQQYPGLAEGDANRVFGATFMGRVTGQIIDAYISRASLLAASPAFEASGITWEQAANDAAKVLKYINGVAGLDLSGSTWYCDPTMENLTNGDCPPEVIWRTEKGEKSHDREAKYFPPTLFGEGYINPTQNLVDAFPMENGYPITDPLSGYDPNNPYAGRDQRFYDYILYNGAKAGTQNTVINTAFDSDTDDGINKIEKSTRTGYYMKKHLRMDVNPNTSSLAQQFHYTARLRYTEFFLNYAEAANEAWGPTGSGSNGYSAYDVVKALRNRAFLGLDNGDAYLESCKGSKEKMRELIRNERRLELCFEGFRFYDLRRWKVDLNELNETAKGMRIENGTYTVFDVDTRNYKPHMYYGPIPYSETLKFSNLLQNAGW